MSTRRLGLVYDLFGSYAPGPEDPLDWDVEYEPEATLLALEAATRRLGWEPVRLGTPHALLARGADRPAVDAALSIAEGRRGRNREAWGPVLLELHAVPQLGSDALTRSLSLDKAWTRELVAAAGVPVAPGASVESLGELESASIPRGFPLFVKPRWEGTSKGIAPGSRVADRAALEHEVARILRDYRQPALVERFLPGPEYTVTLVGNEPPRALPVLQRALEAESGIGVHALERHAPAPGLAHVTPGALSPALEKELATLAVRAFRALRCRDFARVDFKCDADGAPHFLEINPLPTFAPDGSYGVLAEILGEPLEALLASALAAGLARLGLA